MNEQDKDLLLLKDICARLPYGVKCLVNYTFCNETTDYKDVKSSTVDTLIIINKQSEIYFFECLCEWFSVDEFKPYLFPLSSMTEEQKVEYDKMSELDIEYTITQIENNSQIWTSGLNRFNWLLKNHFDVYGLIPMDLAIDATNLEIY
jgi:hypothetical protein